MNYKFKRISKISPIREKGEDMKSYKNKCVYEVVVVQGEKQHEEL